MNSQDHSKTDKTQATPELSTFMIEITRDNDNATLLDIRQALLKGETLFVSLSEDEIFYRQDRSAYVMEVDNLIDLLGPDTAARDVIDEGQAKRQRGDL